MNLIVDISTTADGSMLSKSNDVSQVIDNRRIFLQKHDIDVSQTTRLNPDTLVRATVRHETDWCRYAEIDSTSKGAGMVDDAVIVADAVITRDVNHCIMLPVADCVGAVIYDPAHHILMVSHLGRHSLEQHGAYKSVMHLVDHFNSQPDTLLVWLTPAPSAAAFPVWALDNRGMKDITFEQMQSAGVLLQHITDNPADTASDTNYFSYSEFLKGNRPLNGDHAIIAMMQPDSVR